MSVWDALIGQDAVVAQLSHAASDAADPLGAGLAMTQSWLFTGPPGSGRSTAAACFAAALLCPRGGCGTCATCATARTGAHADVEIVRSETMNYKVDDVRDLIVRSSIVPAGARWHVVIIEDADRFTEESANAMLKVLEEPPPHLVWLLCAPSPEDMLPTIRSRTRSVMLRTPSTTEVSHALQSRLGVDPAMAAFAARASQGHVGRAKALATDEAARLRRQEVLRAPASLRDLPACFSAAADLHAAAVEDAAAITDVLDAQEEAALRLANGAGAEGVSAAKLNRLVAKALKDLKKIQEDRRKRTVRDQLDRALVDLLAYYRDVLVVQLDAGVGLVNDEMRPQIQQAAAASSPADTVRRLDAIEETRWAVAAAGSLPLILEALMVRLKSPRVSVD